MKKQLLLFLCIMIIQCMGIAHTIYDDNYQEDSNYLKGMEYMESAQYASAITEFKKALRTNPKDDSALVGLSNAYNLRAKYYNDSLKQHDKAIVDVKSALFFNKYFRQTFSTSTQQAIGQMEKNLKMLETALKYSSEPMQIAMIAKSERTQGEFAAAAYDYFRLITNNDYRAEANSALGDIYKIFNRPDKSVLYYQESLAANPENPDVHLKLARVYEDVNDYTSSLKEYAYALDKSGEREDILNSLERIWLKRVDENPKDAESHSNLGVVYQKEKRFDEALEEYKKAESLNPQNINTQINIGTLFQEQKRYSDAVNIYNFVLQSQPKNVKVLVYKAECLKELKRNDEAVETYKEALKLQPKNSEVRSALFSLLKETMPVEDVLAFLYQNVLNSPQDVSSYYEFAYELHKAGKIDDAITYYLQTIKMDNSNIDAYINLSQCYREKKNYKDAYSIITRAMELSPDNQAVKNQIDTIEKEQAISIYNDASNAYESGNYEKAIELYLKIQPQTQDTQIGIAAAYQSLNDNNKAIEHYKHAMELNSSNADIPYYIAAIYANMNELDKADEYTKISLSKNPAHSQAKELESYINSQKTEALLEQAVKVYEEENYTEAVSMFDKIVQLSPNDANVYYYRALSYDALNNYQKAIDDYKKAVGLSPQLNIAYYSIGVDYDNLKDYKAAKEYYQMYVDVIQEDNTYKEYAQSRIKELSK